MGGSWLLGPWQMSESDASFKSCHCWRFGVDGAQTVAALGLVCRGALVSRSRRGQFMHYTVQYDATYNNTYCILDCNYLMTHYTIM